VKPDDPKEECKIPPTTIYKYGSLQRTAPKKKSEKIGSAKTGIRRYKIRIIAGGVKTDCRQYIIIRGPRHLNPINALYREKMINWHRPLYKRIKLTPG